LLFSYKVFDDILKVKEKHEKILPGVLKNSK
jgi:hypothetical protein